MINNTFCIQFKDQVSQYYQFNASQISNDEQYLAYGGTEGILKIYDIKQAKIIKEIKELKELRDTLENIHIQACQFTFDSSQLFIAIGKFVIGYDTNDFQQTFKQQIHKICIYAIRTVLNQYLITSSADKTIIKTDIKSGEQIFKLIDKCYIYTIEYNDVDDIIVSGLADHSIKVWDCKNKNVWNNLYKWRVDLAQRDLIKIQEFVDPNKILNFYFYQNSQNLLLICCNYIKILDNQGESIVKIDHQAGEQFPSTDIRQIESARYINIRSANNIIMLAKAYDAIKL
ncbi:hypothetical protein pb186bvf_005665 [Paramecium bursaria]